MFVNWSVTQTSEDTMSKKEQAANREKPAVEKQPTELSDEQLDEAHGGRGMAASERTSETASKQWRNSSFSVEIAGLPAKS